MENTITQKEDVRVKRKSQVIETAKRYMKNKLAVLGLLIFLVILFFALFAGKFGTYEESVAIDIVNKLKSDPRALKSVMQSQDGQALLNMLSGGNSAALGQAARQAASGDTAALSAMLSRVLSSPQGAELVQRLESKLQQ